MSKVGLVVEGGGMKCAYSAGIIDCFLEDNVTFDYCIGVSAGSANLASFTAKQKGRNRRFYTDHIKEPEYFGIKPFLETGNLFNLDYIYGTLSNEDGADYIDYDALMANPMEYELVATNAITGEPEYFSKEDFIRNNYCHIKASSAIPAACKPVYINDIPYFDGGISDPLPLRHAFLSGCDKVVVLMSKPKNYEKKKESHRLLYSAMCHKFPQIVRDLNKRHITYKNCQNFLKKAEEKGKAFVFYLETNLVPGTYTMDASVNQSLFDLGAFDYHERERDLLYFLNS